MIRIAEERASRIARSLSALLDTPLTLVDGGLGVHTESPLTDEQRVAIHDLLDLVRGNATDDRVRELESRVADLQRQNVELVMKNRVLAEVSARDSLTGLYNRWYVMEKIDAEMNRSLRHGSPVALLMLDIDHFKRINDSFGHTAGDTVLRSFGQVLRESCRVYDIPGRYGGEEFCVVLPETRVGNTTVIAERIRQRLADSRFDVGDGQVAITASIGIAGMDSVAEEGIVTSSALVDRADRALYSAKHRGRNRVEVWPSSVGGSSDRNH